MDFRKIELRKHEKLIRFMEKFYSLFPRNLHEKLLIHHRKSTGTFGLVIRYVLLRKLASHVGENVLIQPDVYFSNLDKLHIGDNVIIHPMCYIDAMGGIEIGNNVTFSHRVSIISNKQSFDELDIPIKDQECLAMPVKVGNDVYIGTNSSVFGGSYITDGSVIAVGTVISST